MRAAATVRTDACDVRGRPLRGAFGLLDRYVLQRYAGTYGLCLFGFVLLFLVVDFFGSLDDFLASTKNLQKAGLDLWPLVGRYYVTRLPYIVTNVGAYLTLFAGIATLISFARHNELVPMIASGRSHHRVLAPVYAFAVVVVFALVAVEERVLPVANAANADLAALLKTGEKGDLRNTAHLRDSKTGNVIDAGKWSTSTATLFQVHVLRYHDPEGRVPDGQLSAGSLRYRIHPASRKVGWYPVDGTVAPALVREGGVLPDAIPLPADDPIAFSLTPEEVDLEASSSDQALSGLSRPALQRLIARHPDRHNLEMRLFTRTTRPISSLVLLLLGLPFVSQPGRKSSIATGLGVALGTCAVYVAVDFLFFELGKRGDLTPLVAAWVAPVFFGSIALARLDRVSS